MKQGNPRALMWVFAALAMIFGALLTFDDRLGVLTWLFNEGPDSTSDEAGLWMMMLGLFCIVAGEVAALRQRLDAQERRLREQDSQQREQQ